MEGCMRDCGCSPQACMRAMIDGATEPLFLSSGAEDYCPDLPAAVTRPSRFPR